MRSTASQPAIDRGGAWHPVAELTRARVLEFLREPEAVFWVFAFPILMACALGLAFRSRGDEAVPVGVQQIAGAEPLARALEESGRFDVTLVDRDEVELALARADVQLVVVPGMPPTYRYDPTRTESREARQLADDILQRAAGRADAFEPRDEHTVAVGSRYIDWLLPGLLGMNIMGTGLWSVGFSIVNARTRKLLKRFVATPMKRGQYLLSHMLGRVVFLGLEVTALLLFGWFVFGVPLRGSLMAVLVLTLIGALTFGGIGLLVASRARTIEAVSGLMNVVMLPMWLLSGIFFASSNFPDLMQPLIRALPLTALNDALRAVMLEGRSLFTLGTEVGVLAGWGALTFAVALKIFRWQ
jgi:ABC-type multidrug transport system permease subunit